MTTGDTPQMSSTYYTSTTSPIGNIIGGTQGIPTASAALGNASDFWVNIGREEKAFDARRNLQDVMKQVTKDLEINMARRIVQVFIADTDENVPLEKSVIYTGEQKLTDSTDQELFFEIDIKGILERHNAYRVTLVNKKVKERVENLEPVKIRELKMVVVNVAEFK